MCTERALSTFRLVMWLRPSLAGAVVFAGLAGAQAALAPGGLKAGAAARVVNPSKPAATIGHRVMRLFDNVYCDLRVQALVLEDQRGKRAAWLGCDFCVLHHSVVDRMKKEIHQKHGIEPAAVCINASHTHSAPPLTEGEAVLPEHFDPQYADFVVRQAVAAVGDAVGRLVPARLRYVEDASKIAYNRRVYDAQGRHVRDHCPYPPGVTDPSVQVVVAEAADDGRMIGLAVKFAGHPVNVVNLGIGSDFPGFTRRSLEKRHPGAVAVFLQGCCGDLVARRPNETMTGFAPSSIEMAEALGGELAESVERAVKKPGTPIAGPIEAELREIQLPLGKLPAEEYDEAARHNDAFSGAWGKMYSEMLRRGRKIPETWPYRLQAFRLGAGKTPFTLVALDGEVFCEYGLNLRQMLGPATTIVLGYSNGVVTYLPTAKAIRDGGYEPNAFRWWRLPGPFTPECESLVLKAATALARPKDRARQGRLESKHGDGDAPGAAEIRLVEAGRSDYAIVIARSANGSGNWTNHANADTLLVEVDADEVHGFKLRLSVLPTF